MNKTKEISRLEELLDNSDSSKTEVIDVIMDISRKMRLPYHIKDLEKLLPEQQHAIVYDDIYKQPSRKKCALLPWWGIEKIIKEKSD